MTYKSLKLKKGTENIDADYNQLRDNLRGYNISQIGLYSKNEPLFLGYYDGENKLVAALYVLPEHRGKGISGSLIERIIIEAKKLKYKKVYLFTGDDKRVSLYFKHGWRLIEKVKYKGENSVIMEYAC